MLSKEEAEATMPRALVKAELEPLLGHGTARDTDALVSGDSQCSKYPRYNPDIAPILRLRHLAAMI